jgi:hypothetical protein
MDGRQRSTGAAVRTKFAQAAPALRGAAADVWRLPGLKRRYPEYLRAMHGVIRASVPLMEFAARRCAELAGTDPVAGLLRPYLIRHSAEERGHDDWLLADLAALGCDPGRLLAEQPSPAVARLVGPQYYWIDHHHPVALLGYIAVMEGNAPAVSLGGWIVSRTGAPASAVRTIREHAELDSGHTDAVFELLDRLPLSSAQATAIATSGLYTVDALIALFADIVQAAHRRGSVPDHAPSSASEEAAR